MIKKTLILSSLLALTACGGGGSDSGNGAPPPESFVSGTFYDASQTGKHFPVDYQTHGYYGQQCVGETNYFETDSGRVRVYGSTAHSSDDFRAMATMIEDRLDGALAKFGLTWDLFKQERGFLTIAGAHGVFSYMPEVIPELSTNATEEDIFSYWKSMTHEEQIAFVEQLPAMLNQWAENEGFPEWDPVTSDDFPRLASNFVVGCLNPEMGGSTVGEGTLAGMLMPPEYQQWPNKAGEIVTHELVHFIQINLYNEVTSPYLLPRWFSEGQSVFMAGQNMASPGEHYNYEPQDVISFYDEYGDAGMAYAHYGLAYRYIRDHNSQASINDMLRLMKDTLSNPFNPQYVPLEVDEFGNALTFAESVAFTEAFNATMVDHNGDPLTIERFRTQYHDLMNAAYP